MATRQANLHETIPDSNEDDDAERGVFEPATDTRALATVHDAPHVARRVQLGIDADQVPTDPDGVDAVAMDKSARGKLKQHPELGVRLPAPGVVFRFGEYGFNRSALRRLTNEDIILTVGSTYDASSEKEVHVYATNPAAWAWMDEYASDQPSFDCCWLGTGWENPRDEAGYRCGTCGAHKTRERVEEVFF